jgi:type IV pilus assembly protein PilB
MTLYSALNQLNDGTTNIMTLEDPVEIGIAGVNQTNINPAIGLDFATLLRALLRQDPDIIMIGEIRDSETAEITVKAAQTGHLVLATIHAQDTLEAFARLHYLGINLHDSLRAVKLIMAQRLVRQVCIHCDGHKAGCLYCFGGYYRRTGLFECLPLTVSQQLSISTVSDLAALNQQLAVLRSPDLLTAASQKVAQGVTTQHEIDRVL